MGIDLLIRLVLASILTGLIGWEREIFQKPAGFRTHLLVGLGSSLLVILSITMFPVQDSAARVLAAVVQGIGFLGAGVIIKTEGHVSGLTTAASVWFSAALGATIGFGQYDVALVAFLIALLALQVKRWVGDEVGIRKRKGFSKTGKKVNK